MYITKDFGVIYVNDVNDVTTMVAEIILVN